MSIIKMTEELANVPNVHTLRMTYEDGGAVEVWSTSGKTVRVRCGAPHSEIRAAFEKEGTTQ